MVSAPQLVGPLWGFPTPSLLFPSNTFPKIKETWPCIYMSANEPGRSSDQTPLSLTSSNMQHVVRAKNRKAGGESVSQLVFLAHSAIKDYFRVEGREREAETDRDCHKKFHVILIDIWVFFCLFFFGCFLIITCNTDRILLRVRQLVSWCFEPRQPTTYNYIRAEGRERDRQTDSQSVSHKKVHVTDIRILLI